MAPFERKPLGVVLGDRGYIRGPFGSALVRGEMLDRGIPVYEQQHAITGTREFRFFVDNEKFKGLSRFQVKTNDLIISCSGTIGRISVIRANDPMGIISQALLILRPQTHEILPEFLYYFLSTVEGQHALVQASHGSVQVNIAPRAVVERIEVPIPKVSEQRAIAYILGTLDDTIELNRQMNETLEHMSLALFKSWFMDFDPVSAKAGGRDPKLPSPLLGLFPNEFEASELGEIPKGWSVGSILTKAKLLSGGTPKTERRDYWDGSIAWASAKDVSQCADRFLITTERTITDSGLGESATQLIPAFSTVVVARGATTGRMVLFGREMAMNQTCYALVSKTETPFALYCQLFEGMGGLVHAAHGSVFDTITTSTFNTSRFILAPDHALEAFEKLVSPIFERMLKNCEEARTLCSIRDALLPKLISGELRVKDAEKRVEARV